MSKLPKFEQYNYDVRPLSVEEGGGFMITWPDLAGCWAQGANIPVTMQNGREAFNHWMERAIEQGNPIPTPGSGLQKNSSESKAPRRIHSR